MSLPGLRDRDINYLRMTVLIQMKIVMKRRMIIKKQEDRISGEDGISDNSAKANDDKPEAEIDTEMDMEGIPELFKEKSTENQTKKGWKIRTPARFDDFEI